MVQSCLCGSCGGATHGECLPPQKSEVPPDYDKHNPEQKQIYRFVRTLFSAAQLTAECAIVTLVSARRMTWPSSGVQVGVSTADLGTPTPPQGCLLSRIATESPKREHAVCSAVPPKAPCQITLRSRKAETTHAGSTVLRRTRATSLMSRFLVLVPYVARTAVIAAFSSVIFV